MGILTIASALIIGLSPPNSDPTNVTTWTDVHPVFEEGRLVGCEADFSIVRTVTPHDDGGPIALKGALAVMALQNQEAVLGVKLGATMSDGKTVAPQSVGLRDENDTNVTDLIKRIDITPGYITALYHMRKQTLAPLAEMEVNNILIGYYTLPGETISDDFYVDFRVKNFDRTIQAAPVINYGAGKVYSDCIQNLLKPH